MILRPIIVDSKTELFREIIIKAFWVKEEDYAFAFLQRKIDLLGIDFVKIIYNRYMRKKQYEKV